MSTPFSLAKMVPPMGLTASSGASMPSRDVAFVSRAYKRGAGKKRRWTEEHHWWFGMCFMLVINHPLDILMGHISFYFFLRTIELLDKYYQEFIYKSYNYMILYDCLQLHTHQPI